MLPVGTEQHHSLDAIMLHYWHNVIQMFCFCHCATQLAQGIKLQSFIVMLHSWHKMNLEAVRYATLLAQDSASPLRTRGFRSYATSLAQDAKLHRHIVMLHRWHKMYLGTDRYATLLAQGAILS